MRDAIKNMITRTIIFHYTLPNSNIKKSSLTTSQDECYSVSSNDELADLIYNGIAEYALGEKHIDVSNLDLCQRKAIKSRLRYDETASNEVKLKYGFYGEVVLDLILKYSFSSSVLLAKGYFYNPLEASEPKGYDAYQFYYNSNQLFLLLGEVKFYGCFKDALKKILDNLSKATSSEYLSKNVLALINEKDRFDSVPIEISSIIENWEQNPEINLYQEIKKHNIKLLYPMLVLYNDMDDDFDETIKSSISIIDSEIAKRSITIEIDIDLFFILIPVNDAKRIKETVIECVSQNKPLL